MPRTRAANELWMDVRFAIRQHLRHRIVSAVIIATLGLSVGATTALFALVRYVVVPPSPFLDGQRLVGLWKQNAATGLTALAETGEVAIWRARLRSYTALETYAPRHEMVVAEHGATVVVDGAAITPNLWRFLGISPVLGRSLAVDDTLPASPREVMIGYDLWQSRFGGSRSAIGKTLSIDGSVYTVVGVTPKGLLLPMDIATSEPRQVWLPIRGGHPEHGLMVLGHLRRHVPLAEAQHEFDVLIASIAREYHIPGVWAGRVERQRDLLGRDARTAVLTLFGAVMLLWAAASLSVANVLLGQMLGRGQEFFIRQALGASRGRVARQVVTESMVLTLLGCGLGLFVAPRLLHLLVVLRPHDLYGLAAAKVDPLVLVFGIGTALTAGCLCACVPALSRWLTRVGERVREGSSAVSATRNVSAAQAILIISSVASALVLLIGAGLLFRTVSALQQVDHGIDTRNVLTFRLRLPADAYTPSSRTQLMSELQRRLQSAPDVIAVAYGSSVPQAPGLDVGPLQVSGNGASDATTAVQSMGVGPGYFEAARMPLHGGHAFDAAEAGSDLPAVVNASMAQQLAAGGAAIGRRFRIGNSGPWSRVVGIVSDVRLFSTAASTTNLQVYYPWDSTSTTAGFIVRTRTNPLQLMPLVRATVVEMDSALAVRGPTTLDAAIERGMARQRFSMSLLLLVALLAVLLAGAGIYGVITAQTKRRSREFGLRVALGASEAGILTLVLRQAAALIGTGIAIGLAVGTSLVGLIRGLLYGVQPMDPMTLIGAAVFVAVVALVAALVPARRAMAVDVASILQPLP